MKIIDGKKIASEMTGELKKKPKPEKFMAAILVGNDSASENFISQKEKTAKELGIDFRIYRFDKELHNDELRDEVRKIAEHGTCGGVIVQLPLPQQINKHYVLNVVPRERDVDVISERSIGAFYTGRNPIIPPAAGTAEKILAAAEANPESAIIAVVGLGFLVGKPVSMWLMDKAKGLILLDKFSDLSFLKNADVVICGTGQAGLIKPGMLKDGAGVIDFGYSVKDGKISGDLDVSSDLSKLSFYTPTPGGTGPVLVAKLFENFYSLNTEQK